MYRNANAKCGERKRLHAAKSCTEWASVGRCKKRSWEEQKVIHERFGR